jgi:hypothetical protein
MLPASQACKFRSFRQAISAESGSRFRLKPTGRFGPKRHPFPKALGAGLSEPPLLGWSYLASVSESKYLWHYYPFWLLWRPAVDYVSNGD